MSKPKSKVVHSLESFLRNPKGAKISEWEPAPVADLKALQRIAADETVRGEDRTEIAHALEELKRYRSAVKWALGYTNFRPRAEGEGAYWWRRELSARVSLARKVRKL